MLSAVIQHQWTSSTFPRFEFWTIEGLTEAADEIAVVVSASAAAVAALSSEPRVKLLPVVRFAGTSL